MALETGMAIAYAMDKRRTEALSLLCTGEDIYGGQIVGENTRGDDLTINLCKTKKLTNIRASGTDDKVVLAPPKIFSLEEALEYIQEDELVEVTPKSIRLRKLSLDENERKRRKGV